MQTRWTTEDVAAIAALMDAARKAVETYEWIIADHPELDPDGDLPRDLERLRDAIAAVLRRSMAP